jgi:type III pantothenate kinase
MINLTVDIGNTSVKAALFEGGRLVETLGREGSPPVEGWLRSGRGGGCFDGAIVASTKREVVEIEEEIRRRGGFFLKLDHTTPVPVKNLYASPQTLGADRLAAAVGAHTLYPGRTVLVVDFGTAITFDIVTAAGEYLGGNISPGAGSRFRALHEFTGSLPLLGLPAGEEEPLRRPLAATPPGDGNFPARDTKTAIESGVVTGIVAETERYIERAREKFGAIETIFTGGDADYFAERVKFPIFASSDLVFQGLNAILEYNAKL